MITQVIFKINKKLKDQAMKKAQGEGVPFAAVLKLATRAYVDGQFTVGIISNQPFNVKTRRSISKALEDVATKKNLSPRFTNTKDARAYLKRA